MFIYRVCVHRSSFRPVKLVLERIIMGAVRDPVFDHFSPLMPLKFLLVTASSLFSSISLLQCPLTHIMPHHPRIFSLLFWRYQCYSFFLSFLHLLIPYFTAVISYTFMTVPSHSSSLSTFPCCHLCESFFIPQTPTPHVSLIKYFSLLLHLTNIIVVKGQ